MSSTAPRVAHLPDVRSESSRALVDAARRAVELTRGVIGLHAGEAQRIDRACAGMIEALARIDADEATGGEPAE